MTTDDAIEPDEARRRAERADAVIIDVREPDAYRTAHPSGARNIPIGELADRLDELAGRQVLTACGGGTRGPKAARLLRELGMDAAVIQGGLRAWRAAELPVEGSGE